MRGTVHLMKKSSRAGLLKALENPISTEQIEAAVERIICKSRASGECEVSYQWVGELVMEEVGALDEVAYVGFASVYPQLARHQCIS